MLRKLYISIEYQDWGDGWRQTDEVAAEYGLSRASQYMDAEDLGEYAVRLYPVGRSRRRAEALCDELARYVYECTSLGWAVRVQPPASERWRRVSAWFALLRWTLTHPHDPERAHNTYLLKYDLWRLRKWLAPFERCRECGGYTRLFWHRRDPHMRAGKWVGPDCGLPF